VAATDGELVRGALDGSQAAFRELVERYQRPVFSVIARIIQDEGRAEEIAQDTFVKGFRALHTYDMSRKFSSWLLTIAHHGAIDELRRRAPNTVSLDEMMQGDEGTHRLHQMADPSVASPAAVAERVETAAVLKTAIGRLRPDYRELIALKYEQQLEYEEIVEITGYPIGTVKSSLHRARKELADHLADLGWTR
jgi:RNA polymerase sigma-70 factor (ECF subfamily)